MSAVRGQSAIEYLITYGWMLVAVSVVSGVVFSTVGGECVETSTGFTGADVQIHNFGPNADNQLDMVLENNGGNDINVTRIEVTEDDGGSVINSTEFEMNPGQREARQVGSGFFSSSEHCNTFNVEIEYDLGPLTDQVVNGQITAEVLVDESPEPPQNLEVQQQPF